MAVEGHYPGDKNFIPLQKNVILEKAPESIFTILTVKHCNGTMTAIVKQHAHLTMVNRLQSLTEFRTSCPCFILT